MSLLICPNKHSIAKPMKTEIEILLITSFIWLEIMLKRLSYSIQYARIPAEKQNQKQPAHTTHSNQKNYILGFVGLCLIQLNRGTIEQKSNSFIFKISLISQFFVFALFLRNITFIFHTSVLLILVHLVSSNVINITFL